jgi:hypothetical protein
MPKLKSIDLPGSVQSGFSPAEPKPMLSHTEVKGGKIVRDTSRLLSPVPHMWRWPEHEACICSGDGVNGARFEKQPC